MTAFPETEVATWREWNSFSLRTRSHRVGDRLGPRDLRVPEARDDGPRVPREFDGLHGPGTDIEPDQTPDASQEHVGLPGRPQGGPRVGTPFDPRAQTP